MHRILHGLTRLQELFYFIITGQIRIGDNAIWNWENWYPRDEMADSFVSGIFSIRRWISGKKPGPPSGRYDVMDPLNNNDARFLIDKGPRGNQNAWDYAKGGIADAPNRFGNFGVPARSVLGSQFPRS